MRNSAACCYGTGLFRIVFMACLLTVLPIIPAAAAVPGDLDGNCTVDMEDLVIFTQQWLESGSFLADFNQDGTVDLSDFSFITPRWLQPAPVVVINEIHYDPDIVTEFVEFIELYNASTASADLSGWSFTEGIAYTFPAGVTLAAGAYLVVAQDVSAVQTKFAITDAFGPWVGRLDNDGEKIVLRNSCGQVVDQVDFKCGFPWPTATRGSGPSMELVHPLADNDLGGSWRASNALVADLPPLNFIDERSEWHYRKGTSEPDINWKQLSYTEDSTWLTGATAIGYGESFITTLLSDMSNSTTGYTTVYLRRTFTITNPAEVDTLLLNVQFDDGVNVWVNGRYVLGQNVPGENLAYTARASRGIENLEYQTFLLPSPADYLQAGTNIITVQLLNYSKTGSDAFFDARLYGSRQNGNTGMPTPGAANNTLSNNLPPHIRQVEHSPQQPASGQTVTITAKVTDPDGVADVTLSYQLVNPGSYIPINLTNLTPNPAYESPANWITGLALHDDGLNGDVLAGDNIYTIRLPGTIQTHRQLIRYRLTVTDTTGQSIRVPYADDPQPNFAYFCYDGTPAWQAAIQPGGTGALGTVIAYPSEVMSAIPVYHLISRETDVEACQYNSTYNDGIYRFAGTLVYDGQVYDHIHYRVRSQNSTYVAGKNKWKLRFNPGHYFQWRDEYGEKFETTAKTLNFGSFGVPWGPQNRGMAGMDEVTAFAMFKLAGVPSLNSCRFQLRIIDNLLEADPANQYQGDVWGLYLALEQPDGRWLQEQGLPDGNLYKMQSWDTRYLNQGPTQPVDMSDVSLFCSTSGYNKTSPTIQPVAWWRANVNLPAYYSYRAVVEALNHSDLREQENCLYYHHPDTGQWWMLPWDLDLLYEDFDRWGPLGIQSAATLEQFRKCLAHEELLIEFKNRARELQNLLLNNDQGWHLLDELAALVQPSGLPYSPPDVDRARWDYSPRISDRYGADPGSYYKNPYNEQVYPGYNYYRLLATADLNGFVGYIKNFIVSASYGGARLNALIADAAIPNTPTITAVGTAGFPLNDLRFECSAFSDPQGSTSFAALKWRLGEVTDTGSANYNPAKRHVYEVSAVWESPEITSFNNTITIPAAAVREGRTYRARVRMKDNTGRWSNWSDTIQFTAGAPLSAGIREGLRLTELMYNPAPARVSAGEPAVANDEFEYLELQNIGLATLDLTYVSFTNGVTFSFAGSSITSLAPGQYVLVVKNKSAFTARYGASAAARVAGTYTGSLSNSGELVRLADYWNGTIAEFEYNDGFGWPVSADGCGHALVPLDSAIPGQPDGSLSYGRNWRAGTYINGSCAAADPDPIRDVLLNEIMAHTDLADPAYPQYDSNDWIELYNTSSLPVNLNNQWYLSDDGANLKKWALPGVALPGNSHISFDEITGFHSPITSGFGLDKAGEQVFLSYLPGNGFDRVVDTIKFKGQENFISCGRYPDGGVFWFSQSPSRDTANAYPLPHVVISEIMYHPQDGSSQEEYIELLNPTAAAVSLATTAGSWRLDNAVSYTFPAGKSLAAGDRLVLVGFDPATDATRLTAFNTTYGTTLVAGVNIFGPWTGDLSNNGERIALEKPQQADPPDVLPSWIIVEQVTFADVAPWPAAADGSGSSLRRLSAAASACGDDPANWQSATPTPGS